MALVKIGATRNDIIQIAAIILCIWVAFILVTRHDDLETVQRDVELLKRQQTCDDVAWSSSAPVANRKTCANEIR